MEVLKADLWMQRNSGVDPEILVFKFILYIILASDAVMLGMSMSMSAYVRIY